MRFTAPLNAITAAVVGVIASLGLVFLAHVGWGATGPDLVALALTALALWALAGRSWNVMAVIAGCGALGLGLQMVA